MTTTAGALGKPTTGATVLLFDLMGTVTDWHSSTSSSVAAHLSSHPKFDSAKFAHDWRNGFFRSAHAMAADGQTNALDDIDAIHSAVLDELLKITGMDAEIGTETRRTLVEGWHHQKGWPDSVEGLSRLRETHIAAVLANGTTRFQIDVTKHAGLQFDTLFSSQLLGSVKPRPEMYQRAIDFLGVKPENCAMVAAHFYDLQAAARCGIKTIYINRSTEDVGIDRNEIRKSVDVFVDQGGLLGLSELLQA